MQTLISALGGFLRKHKASVVRERPETLRRYVAANELEFYAVSTFLRRTETVRSIEGVEALIRRRRDYHCGRGFGDDPRPARAGATAPKVQSR